MAIQKKHGKGRLDKWYRLAKEKGYRARAAFKLIQLNQKYNFLQNSKVLIDLCAAPGSWCQVAAECMPQNSLIIGVDLAPIKPIPKVITFQSDITTEKCRATIRGHLKTWKADCVVHDGAPNVGTAWVQDAFTQAELVLHSLKLATEFLVPGGNFITKVFRSRDFNNLMWVFNQLFTKVEATKPPSSRNVSAEIFVVCMGFKAPKKIDPKFLDPRSVFEELPTAAPNNEAKVFHPEKKKRKREGYEEGDYLQYKEEPVRAFIETNDPIAMLGSLNKISFEQKDDDLVTKAIKALPETTEEIQECCKDLRVLGKKDFRKLLKWRLHVREKFGLSTKAQPEKPEGEEQAEVTEMDEELRIEEDLKKIQEREAAEKKKAKRRANEAKRKEIIRMQLNMITPTEIGMEQQGDAMFKLNQVDRAGPDALKKIAKGKMNIVVAEPEIKKDWDLGQYMPSDDDLDSEDEAANRLDEELDVLYQQYQERKAESDAKYRAKKARQEHGDEEFTGFSDREQESDGEVVTYDTEDDSEVEYEDVPAGSLVKRLDGTDGTIGEDGLSKKAAMFFDQDIFAGIDEEEEEEDEEEENEEEEGAEETNEADETFTGFSDEEEPAANGAEEDGFETEDEDEKDGFEVVKAEKNWNADEPMKNGRPDIDIITAEAMSLAQQLATGERTKSDLVDEGFNKYAFRDRDGLPQWFLDEEDKYAKPIKPITAAGAAAIKEKMRALNARPIKKVLEAKGRKKMRAQQRLEKLRKKSALLAEDEGMTEKDKAKSISKLMARAAKKKPKQQVKLVVAGGLNKGKGRPRGVKGKYKIVDARLKKDVRAQKRLAKKQKKR